MKLILSASAAVLLLSALSVAGGGKVEPIVGHFEGTAKIYQVARMDGHIVDVQSVDQEWMLDFLPIHAGKVQDTYFGTWKKLDTRRYSADCSDSYQHEVRNASGDPHAKGKLKLPRMRAKSEGLNGDLLLKHRYTMGGVTLKVKANGTFASVAVQQT